MLEYEAKLYRKF